MEEGKKKKKFMERESYAYWKGNPFVASPSREDLLTCNLSSQHDWNARIFIQVYIYTYIYTYIGIYICFNKLMYVRTTIFHLLIFP